MTRVRPDPDGVRRRASSLRPAPRAGAPGLDATGRCAPCFTVAVLVVVLFGCLPACRTRGAAGPGASGPDGDAATGLPALALEGGAEAGLGADAPISDVPRAEADPVAYAGDDRFLALAATWPEKVRAATERLELTTGLAFRDRAAPRVVLTPLRDERVPFRLSTEIVEGRRRPVLRVGAESLVAGTDRPERVLLHALAVAALEGPARATPMAAWFPVFAGTLAAGDLADRLEALARAAVRGATPPSVDARDPARADATGLAVVVLLAGASTPEDVRRLVLLVADGDDPGALLPRWIEDREGEWVGRARQALLDATANVPVDLDVALRGVRRAHDELGPVGLEEALAAAAKGSTLPVWFGAEADALRLEGAIRTGDVAASREVLERSPPGAEVLGRLADPGAYLLLAARAEALVGGDATLAWRLLRRYALDFPAHPGRAEAEALLPGLLPRLPPELETEALRRVIADQGTAAVDVRSAERRVKALLLDHRPGAARRFLEALGERGEDDDLEPVRAALLGAESEPDEEARRVNAVRVERWLAGPTSGAESDVIDGGAVAAEALAERLPRLHATRRGAAVRALVVAGGLGRAVSLLVPGWAARTDLMRADLEVLAGESGYRDLERAVSALVPGIATDPATREAWEGVALGLSAEQLAADDSLPARLRSPEFAVRKGAFEQVVGHGEGTAPVALLLRLSKDPAILLRRLAVRSAGRSKEGGIARAGLSDPSWIVRQAACAAVAQAEHLPALPDLLSLVQTPDPDARVRAAAAAALFPFAERRQVRIRPLVALLRDPDASLADAVASAITRFPADATGRALASELAEESLYEDSRQDKTALFRLFVAYRRVTGRDPGYDPSLPPERVRGIVLSLPEIRSAQGAPPKVNGEETVR